MKFKNKKLGLVLLIIVLFISRVNAQNMDWQEDLKKTYELVMSKSGHIFQNYDQRKWVEDYSMLLEDSKKMSKNEVRVALMELIAKLKDGHSGIWIQDMVFPDRDTKWFPIRMYYFEEGLYIVAADAKYSDYIGGKVEKIGNFSEREASEKLFEISNGENKYGDMFKAPMFMIYPPILNALGIIEDEEKLVLKVRLSDGSLKEIRVASEIYNKGIGAFFDNFQSPSLNSIRLDEKLNINWQSTKWDLDPPYVVNYMEDKATLYVKLNVLRDPPNFSIMDTYTELWDIVEKKKVDKLILDLRNNGGGNLGNGWPFIFKINELSELNDKKKLIVLTGRKTFSAATAFMSMLETHTNATFIGEPSGGRPNQTEGISGARGVTKLEKIDVDVVLSRGKWSHTYPFDPREFIVPDIMIPESISDWMKGIDSAYNKAINLKLPFEYLKEGSYEKALEAYKKEKENNINSALVKESTLNSIGYQELGKKNAKIALSVFKIYTILYPESANAFDSLGEFYMVSGDNKNALINYEKSLKLDPKSENAKAMINKLLKN